LVAGAGYGLSSYASANSALAADIPDGAGVALFNNNTTFDLSTRLDAAGFSGVGDPVYREGAGLTPAGGVTTDGETSSIRRTATNNTGSNITQLRFRIVDVTTYPVTNAGAADIRALTSGQITVNVNGVDRTVQGTTLEQPPTQAAGGGNNSTLAVGTVTL